MAKLNSGTRIYGTATVDSTLTASGTLAVTGATTLSSTLAVTGITTVAAGSAALPAIISTTGTADTGLWFPAADTLAASTAGTERMRIDSSGKVGIGTTSPSQKLTVDGGIAEIRTGNYLMLRPTDNSWDMRLQAVTTQLNIYSGGDLVNPIMSLLNGGNVGIGTASPGRKLEVSGASGAGSSIEIGNINTQSTTTLALNTTGTTYSYSGVGGSTAWFYGSKTVALGTDSANPVQFIANGAERMRIDSSGNVGIGTTSPVDLLQVNRSSGSGITSGISLTTAAGAVGDGNYIKWTGAGTGEKIARIDGVMEGTDVGSIRFNTGNGTDGFAERMRIDSSGNVGIGTSSPANKLDVTGTIGAINVSSSTGTNYAKVQVNNTGGSFQFGIENSAGSNYGAPAYSRVLWNDGAYPNVFYTNSTERMRIDSDGNLLVGTTASVGANNKVAIHFDKNALNGLSFRQLASDGGGGQPVLFNNVAGTGIGSITSGASSVAYNTSSDYRLKENVAPITTGLATVSALKPVTYDWKFDGSQGEGFIAHELAEVVPHAVAGEKDAVNEDGSIKPQGVDYSKIVVHLVAAIQEQQTLIQSLTARITALESK